MIEKDEFQQNYESDDEMNIEQHNQQQRHNYSRKKKKLCFDEYDLKTLMDDYYQEYDYKH